MRTIMPKAGREMVWLIRYKGRSISSATMAAYWEFCKCSHFSGLTNSFSGLPRNLPGSNTMKIAKVTDIHLGTLPSIKRNTVSRLEASNNSLRHTQELESFKVQNVVKFDGGMDSFDEMKRRFLSFKKHKFLEELKHFRDLAEAQSPKFMVIACTDSRVCPSNILGFQPGEALTIRNVANLVPPLEKGPSETNAALEFAVNTLEVEKILIIGHSSCAGIQTLMSMQDDEDSSNFTEKWVVNGKVAKLRTKADAAHLSFDQQCRHCEKESINRSLLNLLTYPWIKDRVRKELLSVHGGYYDFLNCTFEKWTLDYKGSSIEGGGRYSVKDRTFWS